MTKEKINGRFVVTSTAEDFTDEFVTLDEVDFADMEAFAIKNEKFQKEQGKQNVKLELYPEKMMFVTSWDLSK